jgi:hypothetical protein
MQETNRDKIWHVNYANTVDEHSLFTNSENNLTDDDDLNITKISPIRMVTNIWFGLKIISFIIILIWGAKMIHTERKAGHKFGW